MMSPTVTQQARFTSVVAIVLQTPTGARRQSERPSTPGTWAPTGSHREDVLEVPARADLPIGRLGPTKTAVGAPIVPVPQKAVLAIDIVDQAAQDDLGLGQRSDTADRRGHSGGAHQLQESSPLYRVVSPQPLAFTFVLSFMMCSPFGERLSAAALFLQARTVENTRHGGGTNRLNQSITAISYTKPLAIRMYVISVLHAWLTRVTSTPFSKYGWILCPSPGWLNFGFG